MNIKEVTNNPKLWQAMTGVLTAVLSYFGYVQVSDKASHDVDIVVEASEAPAQPQKNWQPAIDRAINKHTERFH